MHQVRDRCALSRGLSTVHQQPNQTKPIESHITAATYNSQPNRYYCCCAFSKSLNLASVIYQRPLISISRPENHERSINVRTQSPGVLVEQDGGLFELDDALLDIIDLFEIGLEQLVCVMSHRRYVSLTFNGSRKVRSHMRYEHFFWRSDMKTASCRVVSAMSYVRID